MRRSPIVPKLGGRGIWPPFTIPSGIITVTPDTIVRFDQEVPIGLITTKSVGLTPYGGYPEPVFSQYSEDGLSTAIGLSTMGVAEWIGEIKEIYPLSNAFLLTSIFGETPEDFVELATRLEPYTDGLELNFCCPHSLKYGEAVAKQGDLTVEITKQVRACTKKPIVVKLTPNVPDIGNWAKQLVAVGADAIAAIGPTTAVTVTDPHVGQPILSFGSGGLSGPAIRETGVACVRAIRQTVEVPIIASGGIGNLSDLYAYEDAGASIFSIGTALAGSNTQELAHYFDHLLAMYQSSQEEIHPTISFDELHIKHIPYKVTNVKKQDDVTILIFDRKLDADPGQFIFTWLPGIGEKPFGIAETNPLTLAIRGVGKVSNALCGQKVDATVMIRGPYGNSFPLHSSAVIVGGGCGAVPLLLLAQRLENPVILLGASNTEHLLFVEEFRKCGTVLLATDDSSAGKKGSVVELLQEYLHNTAPSAPVFYNCGPEKMMQAAVKLEQAYADNDRIFVCVERHTCCGVGLCGKCALDGFRSCVDGPCFAISELPADSSFGVYKREPSGIRIAYL